MTKKEFDCVEMKWEIQQKMLAEEQEFGAEEARRRQWQRVLNNPILGPIMAELLEKTKGEDDPNLARRK